MIQSRLVRFTFVVAACAVAVASEGFAQPAPRGRPPGVAYDIRVTSSPRGESPMTAALAMTTQNYAGRVVFAAGRGRMDVTEGGAEALFKKGDYVLFDSTDLVIVHADAQEFLLLPHDLAAQGMMQLESMGVKVTIADQRVVIDSVGAGDTIAGAPTKHYRMTTAFTMALDAGFVQQRLAAENITDYWVAAVPGLPDNPLLRANGIGGGSPMTGMFKEFSLKVDSAARRMGSTVALKTTTVSRLIDDRGMNTMTEQRSEVSNLQHRPIDESLLILPAAFKSKPLPGVPESLGEDAGAKWRTLTRARPRPRDG